ncbi:NAD(P)-dependent dehydrogenase, short-chain alcohol dehydrogenase family [Dyella sp. OK004]|uniref:SDR family NAD(P)-dependent oxidoreductase n=1 Tax=Dyella sp. OK004 TaxID=1855292 RepID=UPI0008E0DE90|nr:SDR family oxidoreductase [Dyella sp. OK004]SFR94905.1 NAD(P)-dependent dehydrogenase, short-chain alcohol dehydrogenase family [Dyella sp. OK004]
MTAFASYPSLAGRNVLITGGASGIGASFVEHFAKQGARVGFMDRDDASAHALMAQLGGVAHAPVYQHCDITDLDALQATIKTLREATGPFSVLVNNAANDVRHSLADADEALFEQNIAVNLRHQVFATKAVIPDMRSLGGGSIICLGSVGWMQKNAGYPLYAMAKAGIHGFVNGMARELGAHRIRINCLVPGWVITEKQRRLWLDAEGEASIKRMQCMPGYLDAADLARAALFLAADDSRMCTGQDFIVDGGWV